MMSRSTGERRFSVWTDTDAPRPMVSVAGVRGVVGESLLPDTFLRFILAFATTREPGRPIVVGSDTRLSGEMLRHLCLAGLMSAGLDVIDLGIVPTPTVGLAVRERNAAGGVALTASHNPVEWNALKFFGPDGTFLTEADNKELLERWEAGDFRRANVWALGKVERDATAIETHLQRILKHVDIPMIRGRRFKVVVDCCNGAGVDLTRRLLEALGCEAILFADNQTAPFHREPEPLPENIGELGRRVRAEKADLGFALDPDADRLALVDETGRAIGEERTICLAADAVLAHLPRGQAVCVNLSTTMAVDRVAEMHGATVHRSKIGEASVVAEMRRRAAIIGGEGNGGVIYSPVHSGRDAATGMALILGGLAARNITLSAWNDSFPDYAMLKEKAPVEGLDLPRLVEAVRSAFEAGESQCNRLDGLKLLLDAGQTSLHLRPSGTEPILRVFVESPTPQRNKVVWERVREIVQNAREKGV
jgi:phosphomannomutase